MSTMTTNPPFRSAAMPPAMAATVQEVLARLSGEPGALLPILHAIQDALGYVPAEAVPAIADAINISRAEVHGVITYYHDFRSGPTTAHTVQICRAESCQAMGGDALMAHAREHLGCIGHAPSRDGDFTVEPAYCLGLCAMSPAITLDGKVYARMTPQKLDALITKAREAV